MKALEQDIHFLKTILNATDSTVENIQKAIKIIETYIGKHISTKDINDFSNKYNNDSTSLNLLDELIALKYAPKMSAENLTDFNLNVAQRWHDFFDATKKDTPPLSLNEVRIIQKQNSIASSTPTLQQIASKSPNSYMQRYFTQCADLAPEIIEKLKESIRSSYSKEAKPGNFLFLDGDRSAQLGLTYGSSVGSVNKLNAHASTIYKSNAPKDLVRTSGIRSGGHRTNDIRSSMEMLANDMYRVDLSQLIPQTQLEKLDAQDLEKLQKKYEELTEILHVDSSKHLQHLHVTGWRIIQTIGSWFKMKKFHDRDFAKIAAKMWGETYNTVINGKAVTKDYGKEDNPYLRNNEMICSEFSTKSLIAVLYKLNQWAKDEFQNKSLDPQQEIVNIPFSKQERLRGITPAKMINILKKQGCLKKVEFKELKKLINIDNTKQIQR